MSSDDLHFEALFDERLCVVASADHPLAKQRKVTWRDLESHPWVLPSADSFFFNYVRRSLDQLGIVLPRHVVESASIPFQHAMVLHGSMLSFGLRSQYEFSARGALLVRLPVDLPAIGGTVGVAMLNLRQPSPLALQLVATIRGLVAGL